MNGTMEFITTPIGRLRAIGFIEGISFLLLLGVAMPVKYIAGNPDLVRMVGPIHGLLWIAFIGVLLEVRTAHKWPLNRVIGAVIASVLPFGTFYLEFQLRAEQQQSTPLS